MFQIHLQIENASSPARYGYTERGIMPQRYKITVLVQKEDEKYLLFYSYLPYEGAGSSVRKVL